MMEKSYRIIEENIRRIRREIEEEAVRCGRDPADIRLMAVTKTQPPELVNAAIKAGITLLGENRAQELLEKHDRYDRDGVEIHFIGRLQTNKVRQIVDKVSMVHSVDSLKLAAEIQRQCERVNRQMDVLLEVNVGGELSKSGVPPEQAGILAEEIARFDRLRVRGLMAIPPFDTDISVTERHFSQMRQLLVDIAGKKIDNVNMNILSMGMSGDYLSAIKHGATILRLGSAIFGDRR